MFRTGDPQNDIEQGQEGESRFFLSLRSVDSRHEEGFEEAALPGGTAAQLQHDERTEIGAYFVPVGNIR